MARSTGGKDGDVAIAIAVTVESGETSSLSGWHRHRRDRRSLGEHAEGSRPGQAALRRAVARQRHRRDCRRGQRLQGRPARRHQGGADRQSEGRHLRGFHLGEGEVHRPGVEGHRRRTARATKDNSRSFDAAAAIAVVVDSNATTARIGDGNADADGMNGSVSATGDVSVMSLGQVATGHHRGIERQRPIRRRKTRRPRRRNSADRWPSRSASTPNDAYAHISEQAQSQCGRTTHGRRQGAQRDRSAGPVGREPVTPFLTTANYDTTQGRRTWGQRQDRRRQVGPHGRRRYGRLVQVHRRQGREHRPWQRRFQRRHPLADLGNPVKHILLDKWLPTVATYLNANLGLDGNLVDTWSQAVAEGQKTAIAGAVTVLDFDQTAEAQSSRPARRSTSPRRRPRHTNGDQDCRRRRPQPPRIS